MNVSDVLGPQNLCAGKVACGDWNGQHKNQAVVGTQSLFENPQATKLFRENKKDILLLLFLLVFGKSVHIHYTNKKVTTIFVCSKSRRWLEPLVCQDTIALTKLWLPKKHIIFFNKLLLPKK